MSDSRGRPVPGVHLRVRQSAGAPLDPQVSGLLSLVPPARAGELAYSGKDGAYRITALEPGSYTVEAAALGYARKTIVEVAVAGEATGLDVVLDAGGTIAGRVIDPEGQALPGIEVVAFPHLEVQGDGHASGASSRAMVKAGGLGVAAAKTDAEGRYELVQLPEGEFEVVARARGSSPAVSGPLKAGEAPDLVLAAHGRLSGSVLDANTRAPLDEFWVQVAPVGGRFEDPELGLGSPQRFHRTEGRFLYPELPAGDYDFSVNAEDHAPGRRRIQITPGKETALDLALSSGFRVEGVVRCESTGASIALASLRTVLEGDEVSGYAYDARATTSGGDGRFVLSGLPEGRHRISVEHPGYYREADAEELQFALPGAEAAPFQVNLLPAGRLRGRVRGLPPADPARTRFRLVLSRVGDARPAGAPGLEVAVSPEGEYGADSLVPGTYRLELVRIDLAPASRTGPTDGERRGGPSPLGEVEVRGGELKNLDLEN